jgi:TPR repeat protein
MSGGVFICYRREESAFAARAIYDRVAQKVGRENVFLDVDNIDPGVDWFDALNERVAACDALIAVIGRNWVAADKDNRRRIDDPDDFVRIEIEAALKRGVRVIPVLVDGALMPKTSDLPESLRGFARRQNIEISHTRFEADVERLTRVLASILFLHPQEANRGVTSAHKPGPAGGKPETNLNDESTQVSPEHEETRRYRLAADRGDAHGQASLGFLYEKGLGGLPKDDREAARLYKLAANQGHALGQVGLGLFYLEGHGGLPKDESEAARLFKLSADQGNAQAQGNLGRLYIIGCGGLPKDDKEAARLCELSAEQGNAQGQNSLGFLYGEGRGGLPKDEREAARLYKLSADQGNARGQSNLGLLYSEGRGGLPKDDLEAARLYKLSADQGNGWGQSNLGSFYENGRGGLAKDVSEAMRLYRLAAEQGTTGGKKR